MNKNIKLISLSLLTTIALSATDASADCIGSGFGVGVTLSATQNKVTFNDKNIRKAHEDARNGLKDKLKAAIAATQKKFDTPNTWATELVDDNEPYTVDVYSEDIGPNTGKIKGATDSKKLSEDKETLTLKAKKFGGENPTQYRVVNLNKDNSNKYDKNGLKDDTNGNYVGNIIVRVLPYLLKDNKFQIENDSTHKYVSPSNDATPIGNYFLLEKLQDDGTIEKKYYITPKDQDLLTETDLTDGETHFPTHAKWSDIFTTNNDKIVNAFLKDVINNESTLGYKNQFKDDEWFEDNNNVYIDTVKHKDLGITDSIRDNAISALAPSKTTSNNTFKDVSKWSFDLGFNLFYQHRIFDWFIRAGLFGNFPIANRTISLLSNSDDNNNKDSKDKKSSSNDLSLTHSFDIGLQLLFGYNVTQTFALVFGGEVGYSKYKLNNLNQLSSGYNMDSDKLVEWLAAGSSKEKVLEDYNNTFKNYGLSDKEKSFNKWFWRFVAGCEFNVGKCIVGLHAFFGPNTSLMNSKNNKDFGDLKVVNGGVRASIAFKF